MTAQELIQGHEGLRLKPYKDTVGKVTIGYGRNLSDAGISQGEADDMFTADFNRVKFKLSAYSWFNLANEPRQAALLDMAFNLGIDGLLKFTVMIGCLVLSDYAGAAKAMRNSAWADQVGGRALQDAAIMEHGIWL